MRSLIDWLQPWHLIVFAVMGILFFGAIGLSDKTGRHPGPRSRR